MTQATPPVFPSPLMACLLCLLAWLATGFVIALFLSPGEGVPEIPMAAIGVGEALGIGGIATLAARRVAPPQAERLGLRSLDPRALPLVLALLPLSVVVSELLNVAQALWPAPEMLEVEEHLRDQLSGSSGLAILETWIVAVGIAPVVEEWLYRGVVQQGLIAALGRGGGVLLTALLFGLGHWQPSVATGAAQAALAASLPLGVALGVLRLATGSLLAPILLHALYNGAALAFLGLSDALPVPGLNAPGEHVPASLWLPCAAIAGLALSSLWRRARAIELPGPPTEDDSA